VVSYALLGRISEAQASLGCLLELQPGLTIASLMLPRVDPQIAALHTEGLGKAGLPEE
jgi:hypothetical protein